MHPVVSDAPGGSRVRASVDHAKARVRLVPDRDLSLSIQKGTIDVDQRPARRGHRNGALKAASRRVPYGLLGALVPILLLAAGVRILGLGNTDLWGDEAFSVMTSLGPPSKLLGILATSEPHPPLYPFLLVVWLRAFGSSEFVARLPSAFCG